MASLYLFWRLPHLYKEKPIGEIIKAGEPNQEQRTQSRVPISVIIPARNEEESLPLLLNDLRQQTLPPLEIICVDDNSEDRTHQVILDNQVTLLDASDKPADWMGKAWACLKGAEQASGGLLLFLDADVRLAPDGLAKLVATYEVENCTISVQPYHRILKKYEQFSMFFNIVQIGGNGAGLRKVGRNVGLYGPVILIPKVEYEEIGGHRVAQHTIADDLAIGDALIRAGKKYRLFIGGEDITFRMYGGGIQALFQGWTKNYATGAGKTPMILWLPMFLWVASCTAAPLYMIQALWDGSLTWAGIYLIFYGIWVAELYRIVTQLGNFPRITLLAYPIYMLVFLCTFFWSVWKKLFRRQVIWKGRNMKPED